MKNHSALIKIIEQQRQDIDKLRAALNTIRWSNSQDARTIKNTLADTIPQDLKICNENWTETFWLTSVLQQLSGNPDFSSQDKLAASIVARIIKEYKEENK